VEKPVASAAYGFVRFIGGGLAPYAAGRMVIAVNIHFPFFIGAGAIVGGIVILSTGHRLLSEAERVQAEQVTATAAAAAVAAPAPELVPVLGHAGTTDRSAESIVAAVDGSPMAALVTEAAARLAAADGRAVHVVHVQEDATAGDTGTDGEDMDAARAAVRRQLDLLAAHHVPAEGQILLHATDHGTAGRMIAQYAAAIGAGTIVIGASSHGGLPALMDASASRELGRHTASNILIVDPDAPETLIAADEWSELEASRPR
jgi:nucleotide-binding universal stress UspA family protein